MERTTTALVKCTAVRPLLWLVDDAAIDATDKGGVTPRFGRTDLVVLPRRRHFQVLGLLRQAELFVSVPNGPYLEEAVAFGLPRTSIDADGGISLTGVEPEQARAAHGVNELARLARELRTANSGITERSAAARDGGAARRITTHLGAWLFGRSSEHTGDDAECGVLGANT